MSINISEKLYELFASLIQKSNRYYFKAKRNHEASPYGFFTFYNEISVEMLHSAQNCPKLLKAAHYYKKAIEIVEDRNEYFNEGTARLQLGMLFHAQGNLSKAKKEYKKTLTLLEGFPHPDVPDTLARCYFKLSEIYWIENNKSQAINLLEKNKEIKTSLGDEYGIWKNEQLQSWFKTN
jgi:hypothetical protein